MTTIKTQSLARLQALATTFYVYHKVKGDRAGGPDYDLLKTFTDKAKADKFASDYNDQKGYKAGKGMHSAVVRTTKIKEESSARTKVQSDVDQKEAATIVQQVFADNGIKVKVTTFEENSLRVGYMDPVSKELEQFTFNLEGKKIVFDTLGGPVFSGGEIADQLLKSSPDFKGITKGSDVKAFQRWASSVDKDCAKITQQLDEYNIWVNKFVDAIARLQELVALNKFFKRNAKAK
jgi:ABC-type transport system substrate-binding protein